MVAVTRIRIFAILAAITLGFVLVASPRVDAQSVPGVTVHIEITSEGFVPQVTEVRPGWAVQWTNNDDVNHVVTSSDDDADFVFDTGLLAPGESGAFVFDMEGTFDYFSVTEPAFTGTVIVSADADETPAAPTATPTSAPATATPTPASIATPTATTAASSPTAEPTEPTPELPSTPEATNTPASQATATATLAPAQPTPPPPSAGGAGLNALGGGGPATAGILLGLAVMAFAGASLFYSGSLGRIGIESPRRKK